ncbi:MAG: hypothetical protein K5655_04720, partial [Lachnospiraceae bacterium]|nr:hypothetical protein [Lachnospiraceae bacterium]
MQYDTKKKKRRKGTKIVRVMAVILALIFAFGIMPASGASARGGESQVVNGRTHMFADMTPDTNGIPKYFHQGEKYKTLRYAEKIAFDQMVLLHLYLTDSPYYNTIEGRND